MEMNNSEKQSPLELKVFDFFQDASLTSEIDFDFENLNFSEKYNGNSIINFFTYRKDLSENEIRKNVLNCFNENYNLLFMLRKDNDIYLPSFNEKTISELRDLKIRKEEEIEELKVENYYNPFSKIFWNDKINLLKLAFPLAAISGIIFDAKGIVVSSIFGAGAMEISRISEKKRNKRFLENINENINYYDNFLENLEKSEIKVNEVPDAVETYSNLKRLSEKELYFMNVLKLNLSLHEAYKKY